MRRTLALGLAACAALCGACPGYPHIGARRGPQPEDIDTAGFWQPPFNRRSRSEAVLRVHSSGAANGCNIVACWAVRLTR